MPDMSSVAPDAAPDTSVVPAGEASVEASEAKEAEVVADVVDAGPLEGGPEGSTDADAAATPRWQTVGDLSSNLVLFFDLQIAADGSPYIGMLNLTPPGRARVGIVFRYDGAAWQKIGADLPGSEESSFALAPDGTPYMVVTTTIRSFQQGDWRQLPDIGQGLIIPTQFPAIAVDRSARLNAIVFDPTTGAMGVARFDGTSWELLGARDSFGIDRLPRSFGFDANFAYVATNDRTSLQTDVRRFNGSTWESVGGGPVSANNGAFAVNGNGTAYLAFANGTSVETMQTPPSPWQDLDFIAAYTGGVQVAPAMDIAADGSVYVAYLGDHDPGPDIVPGPKVSRSNGGQGIDLPIDGLDPSVFDAIKIRIGQKGARDVPYIGYVRANSLVVKKLE